MRKTSRYRVLRLEGKRRASQGRPRVVCTKAPLSPHPHPSARQWHRKKLSFQQKIKQASEPRLAGFHEAGRLGGRTPSRPRSRWVTRRPRGAAQLGAVGETIVSPADQMPDEETEAAHELPMPLGWFCRAWLGGGDPRCLGKGMIPEREGLGPPRPVSGAEPPGDQDTRLLCSPARLPPQPPQPRHQLPRTGCQELGSAVRGAAGEKCFQEWGPVWTGLDHPQPQSCF